MEPFEQKLKEYYDQVQPSEAFIARLKALESSPEAMPKPRRVRRYLFPAAAAVMAVAALGAGWASLRASLPGKTPEPAAVVYEAAASDNEDYVNHPQTEPTVPDSEPAAEPEPRAEDPEPAAQPPGKAQDPGSAPEPQDAPAAQAPTQSTPQAPEPPPAPDSPENPVKNDPPAGDPAPPEDDPAGQPEENPDPGEIVPGNEAEDVPIIYAQYQSAGGQETLTLSNLSSGETAVIDVTGLLPPPKGSFPAAQTSESEHGTAAAASERPGASCTGECSAFGWKIRYTLVQIGSGVYAVAEAEDPD